MENLTSPVILAKRVSSFPLRTLVPGLYLVPLCRMMIEPPLAYWPSDNLTPSRLLLESRPLVVDPPDFFVAIDLLGAGSFCFSCESQAHSLYY